MPTPDRPHLSFPFTRTSTGVQVVEQGSQEHVMSQALVVAYCPLGYRDERPEFGWPWPDMQMMPIDPSPLVDAINNFVTGGEAVSVPDAQAMANAALGTDNITINIQTPVSADTTGASESDD